MGSLFDTALNGSIVILLVVTICYAIVLNRKLRTLQSSQSELAAALGRLDGALQAASLTVTAMGAQAASRFEEELALAEQAPPRPAPRRDLAREAAPMPPKTAPARPAQPPVAAPAPARRQKPMLRTDTLAERLEMAAIRPADGQPLVVNAAMPKAPATPAGHRAAAEDLITIMRRLRKV